MRNIDSVLKAHLSLQKAIAEKPVTELEALGAIAELVSDREFADKVGRLGMLLALLPASSPVRGHIQATIVNFANVEPLVANHIKALENKEAALAAAEAPAG